MTCLDPRFALIHALHFARLLLCAAQTARPSFAGAADLQAGALKATAAAATVVLYVWLGMYFIPNGKRLGTPALMFTFCGLLGSILSFQQGSLVVLVVQACLEEPKPSMHQWEWPLWLASNAEPPQHAGAWLCPSRQNCHARCPGN